MSKRAFYRNQMFNITEENETHVTLEGYGFKKKVTKEEVIYEDDPQDDLVSEEPVKEFKENVPNDVFEEEPVDKGIITEGPEMQQLAALQGKEAKLLADLAKLRGDIATMKTKASKSQEKELDVTNNSMMQEEKDPVTTMPSKEWEPYDRNGVNVDSETHADTISTNKKTVGDALQSFKIGLKKMLEDLDDVVSEDKEEIMTEDGEGGGEGATEGVTTDHIAGFMGRTGLGLQRKPRRKELCKNVPGICESYFKIDDSNIVITEGSYYPTLNRHTIFEKLEKHIDGKYLNESSCSYHVRRKALKEKLKPTATIKECASFLAENKFSCDTGSYVPREEKLNAESLYETMNKLHNSMMRKIKKV
jgi:hypothetical protein